MDATIAAVPRVPADLITLSEAARLTGRAFTTIHRWAKTGRLRVWRVGGMPFVRQSDALKVKK